MGETQQDEQNYRLAPIVKRLEAIKATRDGLEEAVDKARSDLPDWAAPDGEQGRAGFTDEGKIWIEGACLSRAGAFSLAQFIVNWFSTETPPPSVLGRQP